MATNFPVLVTTRYVTAGAYIGQLIVPAPAVTPDTRIPAYVGVGSRFAIAKNQPLRRSFVFDAELNFSPVPPYTALLPFNASNDKSVARIVKSDGTEVKINQWQFIKNVDTGKYDTVQINSEVFDPVTTYKISYQSIDRNVLDTLPVAEIREFVAVGNGPDAHDYTEYENFFANFTITQPVPATANLNKISAIEPPVAVGVISGSGSIIQNTASEFDHNYNRYYTVRCKTSGGSTPTRTATFEWTAQPVSAGSNNLPGVPLDPAAPKPTFTINETEISPPSVATTRTVPIELGIVIDLSFGGSNFTAGDTFGFNGKGPALIEIDERHANTNQFYQQNAIVKGAGTGFASLSYAGTSDPNNIYNAKYRVDAVQAADTSVKAVVKALRAGIGLTYTAKVGGTGGNVKTVGLVNPGVQNGPLTVAVSGNDLTVTLATDNTGALISTYTQVANAINAFAASPVTAVTVGAGSTIATPQVTGTADVTNGTTAVTNGVGSSFNTELSSPNPPVPGSKIKFSADPNRNYVVSAATGTTITLTSPYLGPTTAAVTLVGTSNVTNGLISVVGSTGTFTNQFSVGSRLKFAIDPTRVYIVAAILSGTNFELTIPFQGTTNAATATSIPGTDIIEVQAPVGDFTLGVNGILSGTLAWAEYGERTGVSGTFGFAYTQGVSSNPIMAVSNGVKLTLGLSDGPFAIGDSFTFKVQAPRQFYQQKDNRAIILTTDAIAPAGVGSGAVTVSFTTNTPEGGFGIITPTPADNSFSPASSQWLSGRFVMSGNILGAVRNMHAGPTTATVSGGNRHVAANKFTFSATLDGTIDWSLVSQTTETIAKKNILTDVLGVITGQAASPYIILANIPQNGTTPVVVEAVSGLPISYTLVTTPQGDNTQYIVFVTKPTVDVKVTYIFRGAEPSPGQIYYVTSKHVRPDELYNQPILIRSLSDGRLLLAPSEATNHLYIMNEIAMGDIAAPAIYIVQVKDADGDGLYSDVDFADAIAASEAPRAISDLVVLSHFSTLAQQLNSVNKMADPFKRRFRMTWIGAPIGTTIGSEDEPNTLIALSQRTLQVFGANPAHGTRVLVGATSCTRDVKLENDVITEVTMDGSFVAGALAALNASFADPATTVLRQTLAGFKSIQTYGDIESPDNLALGAANIIFFTDQGGGLFRIEEDVTTDTFAPDFNLINNMNQKMFVVKQVRNELDSKLIGLIVPSAEAGVGLVRGFLVQELSNLLGRGFIGRYQKTDGSERPIDPGKDVIVFRDQADPTLYHVLFAFWLRNEIKRIFGLYSVNSNDFGG